MAAPCTDRFTYGRAPAGYEAAVAARPLSAGQSCGVTAAGTGWSVTDPLTIRQASVDRRDQAVPRPMP